MSRPGYHRCPAWRCSRGNVPNRLLMCGEHWAMVSQPLQRAVYTAYARGAGMLASGLPGPALAAAQRAAIDHVDAKLGKPPPGHYPDPITDTR